MCWPTAVLTCIQGWTSDGCIRTDAAIVWGIHASHISTYKSDEAAAGSRIQYNRWWCSWGLVVFVDVCQVKGQHCAKVVFTVKVTSVQKTFFCTACVMLRVCHTSCMSATVASLFMVMLRSKPFSPQHQLAKPVSAQRRVYWQTNVYTKTHGKVCIGPESRSCWKQYWQGVIWHCLWHATCTQKNAMLVACRTALVASRFTTMPSLRPLYLGQHLAQLVSYRRLATVVLLLFSSQSC